MNRLLIQSIEGRILAGIAMFVGIMILVGWVAINEEARMQSFVREQTGRAIERGANLFASNCTTCHGSDGRGIGGFAPALNNPHLFGYDPLVEFNATILGANRTLVTLKQNQDALNVEFADIENPASVERQDEILAELEEIDAQIAEQNTIVEETVTMRDTALAGLTAALDKGLYPLWDTIIDDPSTPANEVEVFFSTNGTRLAQVGWAGDLHGYIVTTLIHGRPGSDKIWGSTGMAAWSQLAGGPLRQDQIEDIATYILNWDKGGAWTTEDVFMVNQFGKPLADGSIPQAVRPIAGTDVAAIMARWAENEIVGDAAKGESLYTGRYGCSSCHTGGTQAPALEGTWTRVENERLNQPEFAGYTVEQYVIESIVQPNLYDYPADTYNSGLMPADFGSRILDQELADIVAFLQTQG